jgi:stage III sporulation protein AE
VKRLAAAAVAALILICPASARAQDPPSGDDLKKQIDGDIDRIISELDVNGLQGQLDQMQNVPEDMADLKPLLKKISSGEFRYMGSDILDFLLKSTKQPLSNALLVFGELLLLIVASGVLAQLTKAFAAEGAAKVANLIVYAAAAIVVVSTLTSAIKTANSAINGLLNVSQGVFPVLSMMLAATGGLASTAVLQPAFSIVIDTASWLTREALIPAALYGGVLAVVGNLTEKNLLSELGSLVRGASVWIAGAVMTVFVAIAAIQGAAAVSYDGISFRAAKYAVDSMVPYVGGMFSDMADTFVGCTLLVRNAVGMAGLLIMVLAVLGPLLTALGVYFALKLAAALSGAFESKQLSAIMGESAKVVMLLVVVMLMCFAMLFFMTTMTVNAGNSILSMR